MSARSDPEWLFACYWGPSIMSIGRIADHSACSVCVSSSSRFSSSPYPRQDRCHRRSWVTDMTKWSVARLQDLPHRSQREFRLLYLCISPATNQIVKSTVLINSLFLMNHLLSNLFSSSRTLLYHGTEPPSSTFWSYWESETQSTGHISSSVTWAKARWYFIVFPSFL